MRKELSKRIFGKLKVIERATAADKNGHGHMYWHCKCDCGKTSIVREDSLLTGNTKSCGCIKKLFHPQETSARSVWQSYRDKSLNFDTFVAYSQMNCHYCGTDPGKTRNIFDRWDTISYTGTLQ